VKSLLEKTRIKESLSDLNEKSAEEPIP
jgi:hypothetical protein